MNKANLKDNVLAEAIGIGSPIANAGLNAFDSVRARLDGLAGKVSGHETRDDAVERNPHIRLRWLHIRESAAAHALHNFGNDPQAGMLAHQFLDVGLMVLRRSGVEQKRRWSDGYSAVAYRLGSTVMAGSSRQQELFRPLPDDPELLAVAMGIRNGDLEAAPGMLYAPRAFRPLDSHVVRYQRLPREALPEGIAIV